MSNSSIIEEAITLANTKSAKKRARQSEKRRIRNRYYKITARTYVKRARQLIEAGDFDTAEGAIQEATKALDTAAQKGCIHKNNAARRKSRLMLAFNKAKAGQQSVWTQNIKCKFDNRTHVLV